MTDQPRRVMANRIRHPVMGTPAADMARGLNYQSNQEESVNDQNAPSVPPTDPEQRAAWDFSAALTTGDYLAAVRVLQNIANAGDIETAALLLEGALGAGVEAVRRMSAETTGPVVVTQRVATVERGATMIGYTDRRR